MDPRAGAAPEGLTTEHEVVPQDSRVAGAAPESALPEVVAPENSRSEVTASESAHSDGDAPASEENEPAPDDQNDSKNSFVDKNFPIVNTEEMVEVCDGVKKMIIKEGRGIVFPTSQSTCFVHYKSWAYETKQLVYDTWEENQPIELVVGKEKPEHKGLAKGVESMKAGERSYLMVGAALAYGDKGNFSFPHVPPRANLLYDVFIVGIDTETRGRMRAELFVEERIKAAERRKNEGNELFKQDNILDAIQQYEMALGYVNEEFMFQMHGKYNDMANEVRHPSLLNLAACMLKLNKCNDAIRYCNEVLSENKKNVKALFRRGKAKVQAGRYEEAKEDFLEVKKLSPSDSAVLRELAEIKKEEKAVLEKQKNMYKGLFSSSKSSQTQPDQSPSQSIRSVQSSFTSTAQPGENAIQSRVHFLWRWILNLIKRFWPWRTIREKLD